MFLIFLLAISNSQISCNLCIEFAKGVKDSLKQSDKLWTTVEQVSIQLCQHNIQYNKDICKAQVDLYKDVVKEAIANRIADPELICHDIQWCQYPIYEYQWVEGWQKKILQDKPKEIQLPQSNTQFNFIQLSDLHWDKNYKEGSDENCGYPICCRDGKGNAGKFGSYKCDIPISTLENSLKFASSLDPSFVIYTGDSIPHDIWSETLDDVIQYHNKTAQQLATYFPKKHVYPVIGNHGMHPADIFKFGQEYELLDYLQVIWGKWLDKIALKTFAKHGYYAMQYPGTFHRIIALNTQACDIFNFWLLGDPTDPGNQLAWLLHELKEAESKGFSIYIIGHIPPNSLQCNSIWAQHYQAMIDRYQNVIRGQFFGHTHTDFFSVNLGVFSGEPVGVMHVAPALTGFDGWNPSFKVYQADSESFEVANSITYRLDLDIANKQNFFNFTESFNAKRDLRLNNLRPSALKDFIKSIYANETIAVQMHNTINTGGTKSIQRCNDQCRLEIYCDLMSTTYNQSQECKGRKDIIDYLIDYGYGDWGYKRYY